MVRVTVCPCVSRLAPLNHRQPLALPCTRPCATRSLSPIVCAQLCSAFNGIVSMHACFPRTHLALRHFVTMMTKHEVVQTVTIESHLHSGTVLPASVPCPTRSTPVLAFTVRGHLCVVLSNVNLAPRAEREHACSPPTCVSVATFRHRTTTRLCLSTVSAVPWSLLVDSQARLSTPRLTSAVTVDINKCICACPPIFGPSPSPAKRAGQLLTLDSLASPCRD